tara:strand:+ start:5072 stop:5968 length:897 start_codon:yes stop_codon:yes gene_type:complete
MKYLVTGGLGFIGSHVVDSLISQGDDVTVLDNLSSGKKKNLNPKAELVICDISKAHIEFLSRYLENVDIVFHLAATPQVQYSVENPTDNNNINSTINILEACRLSGVKRVIFSSSSAVYGNPKYTPIDELHPIETLSPYALHKLVGEQYCKLYSNIYELDTVCLRYFNAYGNRMSNTGAYRSVVSIFIEQHKGNLPLNIVNDGEQRRDFVHVNDIVKANILCSKQKNNFNGEVYNVGTSKSFSVNQIADMFGGDKKYGEQRIEPKDSVAENSKVVLGLGWSPTGDLNMWINSILKNEK